MARPDTILRGYQKLIVRKFDGSKFRRAPGRPRVDPEIDALILCIAKENSDWGDDQIAGALANLGYKASDQTIGNIFRRSGPPPAPIRQSKTTWRDFIRLFNQKLQRKVK